MEPRATALLSVTIALLAICWVLVPLRCYVRISITSSFGLDDWLIVLSQLLFTVLGAFLITGVHSGLGEHTQTLSPEDLIYVVKYETLSQLIYILTTATVKLSVGALLLRIVVPGSSRRAFQYVIWTSMAVATVWAVVSFFIVLFRCMPVSNAWNPTAQHSCQPVTAIQNVGYAFAAMDIFFDWLFALIPIPLVWNVKMSLQMKASVVVILGMGVFASFATSLRLNYIVALPPGNAPYGETLVLIWSTIEVGIAISAAAIATLRPLMRRFAGFSIHHHHSIGGGGGTDSSGKHSSSSKQRHRRLGDEHTDPYRSNDLQHQLSFIRHNNSSKEPIVCNHSGTGRRIDVETTTP